MTIKANGKQDGIPPEWLPQATVYVTVIYEHDDYDTMAERVDLARDWAKRGDDYILKSLNAANGSRIVAAFPGYHYSEIGYAIPI